MGEYASLTSAQVQSFLDNGCLVVKDCLDHTVAERWVAQAYDRLGYDPRDPTTWQKDIVWMDHHNQMPVRDLAPRAWAALLDVVGGEDRLENQVMGKPRTHFSSINQLVYVVRRLCGQLPAWRRSTLAAALRASDGLAQGRQLLSAFPG